MEEATHSIVRTLPPVNGSSASRSLKERFVGDLQGTSKASTLRFEVEREKDFPDADGRYSHGVVDLKRFKSLSYKAIDAAGSMPTRTRDDDSKTVKDQTSTRERNEIRHKRRHSHETVAVSVRQLFQIDVQATAANLLKQEDTDDNEQITVEDGGPKVFCLATENSNGFRQVPIRGAYQLANLLQELAIAQEHNRKYISLSQERLNEPPVTRLARRIGENFWDSLTRRIDEQGLLVIGSDPKDRATNPIPRIYVPYEDEFALQYYQKVAEKYSKRDPPIPLEVIKLPQDITPEYVMTLNDTPGLLSLALRVTDRGTDKEVVKGTPYVVPGGRFNEMYGWDSYFEALGLLVDERPKLAASMVENFCYEIEHYGKILNANRTYYLTRSQPPFLTDMAIQTLKVLQQFHGNEYDAARSKRWLGQALRASVKELFSVWLAAPRLDRNVGLCKYHPSGKGVPPETEATHFDHILQPYAKRYNLSVEEYIEKYNSGEIHQPELDEYLLHDRAVRESGHDTTYRFEKICAHLATVDLNSLTYKYMIDLSKSIKSLYDGWFTVSVRRGKDDVHWKQFNSWLETVKKYGVEDSIGKPATLSKDGSVTYDSWTGPGGEWDSSWGAGIIVIDDHAATTPVSANGFSAPMVDESDPTTFITYTIPEHDDSKTFTVSINHRLFDALAKRTRDLINLYLWNEEAGLYFDFDCSRANRTTYESVTTLWPMWASLSNPAQVDRMLPIALSKFEVAGGLVAGTESSRGPISLDRPNRQWDYPFGWAPHQMLAWKGLAQYGYRDVAERLAYRWMYTVMRAFVDFNGVVVEKLDVVGMTHRVAAEYGNVGADFKRVVKEGFGWMNASVKVALHEYVPRSLYIRNLNHLVPPERVFFKVEGDGHIVVARDQRSHEEEEDIKGQPISPSSSPEPVFEDPSTGDIFGSVEDSSPLRGMMSHPSTGGPPSPIEVKAS
ncbi:alpha,alpha-trehalase [Synchytrium microbalum]|uniref:Trehalase n=1 Tax=Synchytrium microbalum TaxID=1806994 RepID=A0A507CF84_9FUNG|nr:alpha,alpha-trehalase [Synchytrium microbalum]TPX36656.1 alpha,alpha-trehalase [Synchytrium microbalum]